MFVWLVGVVFLHFTYLFIHLLVDEEKISDWLGRKHPNKATKWISILAFSREGLFLQQGLTSFLVFRSHDLDRWLSSRFFSNA